MIRLCGQCTSFVYFDVWTLLLFSLAGGKLHDAILGSDITGFDTIHDKKWSNQHVWPIVMTLVGVGTKIIYIRLIWIGKTDMVKVISNHWYQLNLKKTVARTPAPCHEDVRDWHWLDIDSTRDKKFSVFSMEIPLWLVKLCHIFVLYTMERTSDL